MWFRFSRPDYFYVGHYRLIDAGDASPWNRGITIGFGLFMLHARWNNDRSESEGVHYPTRRVSDIEINGTRWPLQGDAASYEMICAFAGQGRGATVTWFDRATRAGGTLIAGERLLLRHGLVFTAVMTDSA